MNSTPNFPTETHETTITDRASEPLETSKERFRRRIDELMEQVLDKFDTKQ